MVVVFFTFAPAQANAGDGPVSNDTFANALPVDISGGSGSVGSTNVEATKEPGEPNHAENIGGRSIWFKLTPTATTVVRINTMQTTFDTLLAVYVGPSVNTLTLVGYNDDCRNSCGGASTVDLMVTAGVTYYIAVDGHNSDGIPSQGTFNLSILDSIAPMADGMNSHYDLGTSHRGTVAGTNYNATREAGEPIHINPNYPGDKSVWYKWIPSGGASAVSVELTENFASQIAIYKSPTQSPTFAQLTRIAWNFDTNGDSPEKYRVRFYAIPGSSYFIAVGGHSNSPQLPNAGNFQLKFQVTKMSYSADYDEFTRRASISLFRPSDGNWYDQTEMGSVYFHHYKWGTVGDTPMSADVDGDGRSERIVARNVNGQKIWYIDTIGGPTIVQWGLSLDKAVIGDFDGDSRADLTAIRPTAQGYVWYVRQSLSGSLRTFNFGTTGDRPVFGDFDGDGRTEVAVVRTSPTGMAWYILHSSTLNGPAYTSWTVQQFGWAADAPAVEDYDGDEKTDIAVFRQSTGTWYILRSGSGQLQVTQFGSIGDKPQPADYDGDGKSDLALFRPATGEWFFWRSDNNTQQTMRWGTAGDVPVSSLVTLSQ